jgi:hypothetical protein
MGYMELKGTDTAIAQDMLQHVLDRQDIITMIVLGSDQAAAAAKAKEVSNHEPNRWWVVWVQNVALLTGDQLLAYKGKDGGAVVCVLSKSDMPVCWLSADFAGFTDQLLSAFNKAQQAA